MRQINSENSPDLSSTSNIFSDIPLIASFPEGKTAWRIDWLGSIGFPNRAVRRHQPSILVYLSRVTDPQALIDSTLLLNPEPTNHANSQIRRWVSVGALPLLRVGDVWRDRRLMLRPDYCIDTFLELQIDGSTTTLIKAGLTKNNRDFLLPLAQHPWHRQCTQSYCVEVSFGDGRRLIIPCMELVRFYFGSSSGLISRLFLPPLIRDTLYKKSKWDPASGRLTLKLAEKMCGTSASDIGRLCLDPLAWRSAIAVGTSLLKGAATDQHIFAKALFPFEGTTNLVASGKWLSFAGSEHSTFVAFNLHSCSHRFPFASLKYEVPTRQRDSNNGYSHGAAWHTGAPDSSNHATRHMGAPDSQHQVLVERDASNRLAAKTKPIAFEQLEQRFPDLRHKAVWKSVVFVDTNAAAELAGNRASTVTEVAVGVPGSEQRIRPIDLAMTDTARQPPVFLRSIVKELRELQGTEVTLLTAGEGDGWTIPIQNLHDEDGKINPRAFVAVENGKTRSRLLSAFRLSRQDDVDLYLVLIEAVPVYARFHPVTDVDDLWQVIHLAQSDFFHRKFNYKTLKVDQGFKGALRMAFGPYGMTMGALVLALDPEPKSTAAITPTH